MKSRASFRKIIFVLISISIIYAVAVMSLPILQPYLCKAAIVSAGITFLEGGKAVALNNNAIAPLDLNVADTMPVVFSAPVAVAAKPTPIVKAIEPLSVKPINSGTINRKTFVTTPSNVYVQLANGFIKNCTDIDTGKIASIIKKKPAFKIKADGTPQVLIMHTHATESYQADNLDWFSKDYTARTTDNTKNMIAVGDKIQAELEANGIGVMHDKTLHDYPSYNGSYERSAITVKRILKENPSIKVVLDVHRDAIQPDANTMTAPVTTIDGKSCAQVMIISGCDNGTMNMPKYMENLKFSALLQNQMEQDYKTLTRPILFDYRKYNQDLTTGSILLEMGGHANTLDEALYAGELLGKSLSKALLSLK